MTGWVEKMLKIRQRDDWRQGWIGVGRLRSGCGASWWVRHATLWQGQRSEAGDGDPTGSVSGGAYRGDRPGVMDLGALEKA